MELFQTPVLLTSFIIVPFTYNRYEWTAGLLLAEHVRVMISPWQTVVSLGTSWTISGGTKLKIKVKRRFLPFRSFPSFLYFTVLFKFISDSQSPIHDSISRSLDSGLTICFTDSLRARFKDQLTETYVHFYKERDKWLQRQPHVPN